MSEWSWRRSRVAPGNALSITAAVFPSSAEGFAIAVTRAPQSNIGIASSLLYCVNGVWSVIPAR